MNAHMELARARKAGAIASMLLAAYDATDPTPNLSCADCARAMDEGQRIRAAEAAGQRVPSDETWNRVVGAIEAHERVRAALAGVA